MVKTAKPKAVPKKLKKQKPTKKITKKTPKKQTPKKSPKKIVKKSPKKIVKKSPKKPKKPTKKKEKTPTKKPQKKNDIFAVEYLKAAKKEGNTTMYLVKWEGYPESQNTWEPAKNILDSSLISDMKDRVAPRAASGLRWQYFLDSPVDGKVPGWYDYDLSASESVEAAYQDWQSDATTDVRSVRSGHFSYQIDFNGMTQTNIDHPAHRVRSIRRLLAGEAEPPAISAVVDGITTPPSPPS
eukprot:CAMPEP_0114563684 /NCGR_PEP_ID=MMETSP0114-20121206/13263_1 /TAXON_ID=31324 /ORGANISM="Goniomonas sp, Strain m" /LENGTH=239 /DNA_ID=CAMNT_0001749591 /DNA_START=26 /DNA_END=745 /DNA_ORIENTATION=+